METLCEREVSVGFYKDRLNRPPLPLITINFIKMQHFPIETQVEHVCKELQKLSLEASEIRRGRESRRQTAPSIDTILEETRQARINLQELTIQKAMKNYRITRAFYDHLKGHQTDLPTEIPLKEIEINKYNFNLDF